jgi:hypothetical protein
MVMVQVRDVPEDLHAELTRQAENAGQSLNKFLLEELRRIARRGRNAEVLSRAAARPGPRLTREQIVEALREVRDE